MHTLTANDAKRNFGELLLSAQREPVKISKNSKDAVVVMSMKDFEDLEAMKAEYIKLCFETAKKDKIEGKLADGDDFMSKL
ncbi:antitoxin [Alteromonas sp. KUL17]|uniref:type II toxin-antitoxin system Phd/YefM family antitoxin n=1 Tax=Alteromonas sp. KUL17 TaxID=2480796 RepID=UPI00103721DF|nr:type II toxin-antitoxin system Phd/YefM family antitoxin [Alteromonas sp. KUL17]TAP29803.1 type II toxin-antitoxin system Phd/YefM family antitoxin [Alteromonas sp. KUL17]GEA02199.1 antitoxin [Alteromonas sp. KUL17]